MKRNILDSKCIATDDPAQIAEFVHTMTKRGFEPMPMQCVKQFGTMTITMGLFEEIKDEPVKEQGTEEPTDQGSSKASPEPSQEALLEDEGKETAEVKKARKAPVKAKPKTEEA